jgi:nucleotide sugar dehydrogenase
MGATTPVRTASGDGTGAGRDARVAVVGTGYVGAVTATCLAWLGVEVVGADADEARVEALRAGTPPFFEPRLDDLLAEALRSGRLTFTTSVADAAADADVVFLCVGTPLGPDGRPDLSQVEGAASDLAGALRDGAVVVNKSTVPVGSANWVHVLIEQALPAGPAPSWSVVSNPEFLREGSAIDDFLHPDRIVLGGDARGLAVMQELYRPVLEQRFPGGDPDRAPSLFLTDLTSAEMIKYASNAFLATKISFANEVAAICDLVGADVREVLPAIGADRRIGAQFLGAGIGWGGSCFRKDLEALIATAAEYGATPPLLRASVSVNDQQRASVVRRLQEELKVLKGRRIGLLGLAFKPETDDLRDAPSLDIARRLVEYGALVRAYDPIVRTLGSDDPGIAVTDDPYDAIARADAVVVVTEWPEFVKLDPRRVAESMAGTLVIDGRACLDAAAYERAGLHIVGMGWRQGPEPAPR